MSRPRLATLSLLLVSLCSALPAQPFSPQSWLPSPFAFSVATGDWNGDGFPDAATTGGGQVTVHLNVSGPGGIAFTAANTFATPNGRQIEAADVDGDQILDLVVLVGGSLSQGIPWRVRVYRGLGNGAFQTPAMTTVDFSTNADASLALGDFDDDGRPDIAVTDRIAVVGGTPGPGVWVVLNSGTAPYYPAMPGTAYAVSVAPGPRPSGVVAVDLNGDGADDLAVPNGITNDVGLLYNNGFGGFGAVPQIVTLGFAPGPIKAGDLDGNGFQDLVIGSNGGVTALSNFNGTGAFAIANYPGDAPSDLVLADTDADQDLDVVTANQFNSGNPRLSYYLNGAGSLAAPTGFSDFGTGVTDVAAADFDLDGRLDFVHTVGNGRFAWVRNLTPSPVRPGTGGDLELLTGVTPPGGVISLTNGPAFNIKNAAPGDLLSLHFGTPLGTLAFLPVALGVQLFPTAGSPPLGVIPGSIYFDLPPASVLIAGDPSLTALFGTSPVMPFGGIDWSLIVPAGLAGTSALLQGVIITNGAPNGAYYATSAHEIRF